MSATPVPVFTERRLNRSLCSEALALPSGRADEYRAFIASVEALLPYAKYNCSGTEIPRLITQRLSMTLESNTTGRHGRTVRTAKRPLPVHAAKPIFDERRLLTGRHHRVRTSDDDRETALVAHQILFTIGQDGARCQSLKYAYGFSYSDLLSSIRFHRCEMLCSYALFIHWASS